MKKMCVKNIKAGKTVYYVHALGENSFTIKYLVTGRPKTYRFEHVKSLSDSLFVHLATYSEMEPSRRSKAPLV